MCPWLFAINSKFDLDSISGVILNQLNVLP
jgi:hypothetical protein